MLSQNFISAHQFALLEQINSANLWITFLITLQRQLKAYIIRFLNVIRSLLPENMQEQKHGSELKYADLKDPESLLAVAPND